MHVEDLNEVPFLTDALISSINFELLLVFLLAPSLCAKFRGVKQRGKQSELFISIVRLSFDERKTFDVCI